MFILFIPWLAVIGLAVWRPRWATPAGLGMLGLTVLWVALA